MSTKAKTVIIAAGASGGHLFPALSVANKLREQGFRCIFVGKGGKFSSIIKEAGYDIRTLPASPWNVRNPLRKFLAIFNILRAFIQSVKIIHQEGASVVFGTGGYDTVAALMAAKLSGAPTVIQEQNVLPGRANRFLAKWVDKVCLTFEASRHYLPHREGVMVVTGNPIRESVLEYRGKPREDEDTDKFQLLVVGGSQGARIFSDVVPQALNLLKHHIKKNLYVVQQTRPEDLDRVKKMYHDFNISERVETFFTDLEKQMLNSHLIISRSGTSTMNEISILGRAAIYVPLKLADGHQLQNAKVMESLGAALIMEQQNFTAEKLAEKIEELFVDRAFLAKMEKASFNAAVVDAADKVAQQVVKLSEQDILHLREELNSKQK